MLIPPFIIEQHNQIKYTMQYERKKKIDLKKNGNKNVH